MHSNRVFHYKSSILGYPYFWKHLYVCCLSDVFITRLLVFNGTTFDHRGYGRFFLPGCFFDELLTCSLILEKNLQWDHTGDDLLRNINYYPSNTYVRFSLCSNQRMFMVVHSVSLPGQSNIIQTCPAKWALNPACQWKGWFQAWLCEGNLGISVRCWNIQSHNFFGVSRCCVCWHTFWVRWNRVCHTRKIQEPRARADPRDCEKHWTYTVFLVILVEMTRRKGQI